MPSTTELKKPKKKPAPAADERSEPKAVKTTKRAKKSRDESDAEEEPESQSKASGSRSKDSSTETSDAKPQKRSAKSKTSKKESSADDEDSPAPESKSKSASKSRPESKSKPGTNAKPGASSNNDAPESKPATRGGRAPIDLASAVLQALATNERMNQYLLENLDDRTWNAPPPNGQGRTIAAIVSHMHNVRHMWLTVAAKKKKAPDKLDRRTVTKPQAMSALAASSQALLALFETSLEQGGRVKDFRPDVVGFLGYVIAHEAHHRGQICMLAREIGMPLSQEAGYGMWDWNKRWKECGYAG